MIIIIIIIIWKPSAEGCSVAASHRSIDAKQLHTPGRRPKIGTLAQHNALIGDAKFWFGAEFNQEFEMDFQDLNCVPTFDWQVKVFWLTSFDISESAFSQ